MEHIQSGCLGSTLISGELTNRVIDWRKKVAAFKQITAGPDIYEGVPFH